MHRDLTALAPRERLTELPVLLREKPHTSARARENLRSLGYRSIRFILSIPMALSLQQPSSSAPHALGSLGHMRAGSQDLQHQLLAALQPADEGPPASMSAWTSKERQGQECPVDPPSPSLGPLWSRRHPKGFDEKPPLGPQGSRPLPERRRMTAQPPLSTGGDRGRLCNLWGVLWDPCYTGWIQVYSLPISIMVMS